MTSQASITYAGVSSLDRTRALKTGEWQPGDTELRYLPFTDVAELFRRMAQDVEFDAAEMSLSTYVMMRSRGDDRLVGIPVFPSRAFRHSQIYLHAGSGIERPEDLRGRDVGVPEYQMTAALWIRGILADEYGVGQEQIAWKTGGLWSPDFHERLRHDPPPGVTIDRIPGDRTLEQELRTVASTRSSPRTPRSPSVRARRASHDSSRITARSSRRTAQSAALPDHASRRPAARCVRGEPRARAPTARRVPRVQAAGSCAAPRFRHARRRAPLDRCRGWSRLPTRSSAVIRSRTASRRTAASSRPSSATRSHRGWPSVR